jgi:hypothetical protein
MHGDQRKKVHCIVAKDVTFSPVLCSYLIDLFFIGLAYQGKDIVFRFILEYGTLRDFGT